MKKSEIISLVEKYASDSLTDPESILLDEWLKAVSPQEFHQVLDHVEILPDALKEHHPLTAEFSRKLELLLDNFDDSREGESNAAERTPVILIPAAKRWMPWIAAAILLLMTAGGSYLIRTGKTGNKILDVSRASPIKYKEDVQPGHSGAVLHLSNNNTVILDSVRDGIVAMQGGLQVVKVNGELKYIGETKDTLFNTITTDRGRQWQLLLPDGTKVWLDAASSIRYPLAFSGPARVVEITGEAYFEVVHNSRQPFKVKTGSQVIEDVGTSFNVNAYDDEPEMKTTLVEGMVKIGGVTIHAGQQAVLKNKSMKVKTANVEQAIAWKNGVFSFDSADISAVMRQLARWYDVEVKFEQRPDNIPYQGEIGRSLTLAQVLKVLEKVHLHFRIEQDKRIVILP